MSESLELEEIAREPANGVRTPGAEEIVAGLRLECVDDDTWTIATVDGAPVDRVTIDADTQTDDVVDHLGALSEVSR